MESHIACKTMGVRACAASNNILRPQVPEAAGLGGGSGGGR